MIVGVLAVQGDFAEHIALLKGMSVQTQEVRLPHDLEGVDALIIPGGESTTLRYLLDLYDLTTPINQMASSGIPTWGTCAGMILMARELIDNRPTPLGLMDISVVRNAFGRQVDSFEADLEVRLLGQDPFHAIFIRAPSVVSLGEGVEVLARLPDGTPVALRQHNLLATAFHPELTSDIRFHEFFLSFTNSSNTG